MSAAGTNHSRLQKLLPSRARFCSCQTVLLAWDFLSLPHLVLRKFNIVCIELLLCLLLPFCPTQAVSRQIALEQQLQMMRETDHMLQVLQENLVELDRQLTSYLTDRVDAFQMPQEAQVF